MIAKDGKFQEIVVTGILVLLGSCQVEKEHMQENFVMFNRLLLFIGVRELFEQEPMPVPKKSRAELMKDIDADYYGYRDDDDGILIPLEQEAEKEGIRFRNYL